MAFRPETGVSGRVSRVVAGYHQQAIKNASLRLSVVRVLRYVTIFEGFNKSATKRGEKYIIRRL